MTDLMLTQENGMLSRRRFLQGVTLALAGASLGVAPGRRGPQWPALAAPALRPRAAQNQTAVDVTDPAFGARGDGVTNDRAAFQAAIVAAIQSRRPLWIPRPAQFYRIVFDATNDRLVVDGDLTIVGESRADTLIRFSIPAPDLDQFYYGFFVHNGCNFQITECRVEEDAHLIETEFYGFFFEAGPDGQLALFEGLDVDGFTDIVISNASGVGDGRGELFVAIRDCDFKPFYQFCVALWTAETGHKRLHVYDSYFHDNSDSHLVYCHPHNSVHIENTRFDGATSWAFQLQGSAISGDPEYQRFIGCWFGPRNGRGIITHSGKTTNPRPEIRNCVFEARAGIQIRSDVLIDGCYFTNARDAGSTNSFVMAIDSAPFTVEMRNCIFAPKHDVMPHVELRLPGIQVTIDNCQFYHQGYGSMVGLGTGPTNSATIRNCLFYVRADDASQAMFIEVENGQNTVTNCRFHGRAPHDRGVFICRNHEGALAAEATLQIDDCTFQGISAGHLIFVDDGPGNSWSGRISGSNNRIENLISDAPLLAVEGSQTPFYARLAPTPGSAPVALIAAPTTVVSSNYDTYPVNGPADIANLHWWTDDGASDALFSGAINLTAVTPFALVTGGNIRPAGGASRRDVAGGATVKLTYDSSQGAWSE